MNPNVPMAMSIADIRVGERRREDYGDIDGLAQSIRLYGLLHPIVIDDDGNLVAGERRLRACRQLGWTEIETTNVGLLTDASRREIELEENLRRKDLTQIERDKDIVALAEMASQAIAAESIFSTDSVEIPKRGRPPKAPVAEAAVSERINTPVATIRDAKAYVSAVDRYPETIQFSKTDAVKVAAKLDAMPEEERVETRAKVMVSDPTVLADLTDRPPLPDGPSPYESAINDPGAKWSKGLHKALVYLNSARDAGGYAHLCQHWDRENRILAARQAEGIATCMLEWRDALLEGTADEVE